LVARDAIRPGVTTKHLDDLIRHYIEKCGARPSFLGYGGFPGSACISVNDQVIHGIPSAKVELKDGDIVKVDVGAYFEGFHGDAARSFPVGKISEQAEKLIRVTEECFWKGVEQIRTDSRLGDLGHAVESHAILNGYSVVKKYIGHGVGKELHESPDVPNYGIPGRGQRIIPGMVIAIEPMINVGTGAVRELADGWTVVTADGALSAHYENTVAITPDGVIVMTKVDE
jgi:methionyl aminopeptidase